jgi:Las17-binding protein actin regulator
VLLQGFTLGYEAVDSLIVIDTPAAVKAFTTTSFSIDADVGMGVGKLAGQVTPFSYSSPASCSPLHCMFDALEMLLCCVLDACVQCRR